MAKSNCIQHPPREPIVLIRRWQIQFCQGNQCAAALLNFYEYWHNIKLEQLAKQQSNADETCWQFHTLDEIATGINELYSKNTISVANQLLKSLGVIRISSNPNPKYTFDRTQYILFQPEVCNRWLQAYENEKHTGEENDDNAALTSSGVLESNAADTFDVKIEEPLACYLSSELKEKEKNLSAEIYTEIEENEANLGVEPCAEVEDKPSSSDKDLPQNLSSHTGNVILGTREPNFTSSCPKTGTLSPNSTLPYPKIESPSPKTGTPCPKIGRYICKEITSKITTKTTPKITTKKAAAKVYVKPATVNPTSRAMAAAIFSFSDVESELNNTLTHNQQRCLNSVLSQQWSRLKIQSAFSNSTLADVKQVLEAELLNPNAFKNTHPHFLRKLNAILKEAKHGRWVPTFSNASKKNKVITPEQTLENEIEALLREREGFYASLQKMQSLEPKPFELMQSFETAIKALNAKLKPLLAQWNNKAAHLPQEEIT